MAYLSCPGEWFHAPSSRAECYLLLLGNKSAVGGPLIGCLLFTVVVDVWRAGNLTRRSASGFAESAGIGAVAAAMEAALPEAAVLVNG